MKVITILSLLLLASPAFGELTKEDIRTIIKEEVRPIIKEEIDASEKRTREYIDLKVETINARIDALDKSLNARIDATNTRIDSVHTRIDAVEKRIDELDESLTDRIRDIWLLLLALIGLITAAIAIPQIIIAFKERGQKEMQTQIDQLREQIEAMQNPPS